MDGNDFNLITPVNSLQNIGSMTRVERREQRQQRKKKAKQEADTQLNDMQEDRIDADQSLEEFVSDTDDPHSIDYRA